MYYLYFAIFLIFLTLKLVGIGIVATWSWVWIFAPLWIPFLLGVVFLTVYWLILGVILKR
jgi:hypothetical protein